MDVFGQHLQKFILGMLEICHGGQSYKQVHFALNVAKVFSQSCEHLSCTLRVSNVGDLLFLSLRQNVVNCCCCVELTHLKEREIVVSCVILR